MLDRIDVSFLCSSGNAILPILRKCVLNLKFLIVCISSNCLACSLRIHKLNRSINVTWCFNTCFIQVGYENEAAEKTVARDSYSTENGLAGFVSTGLNASQVNVVSVSNCNDTGSLVTLYSDCDINWLTGLFILLSICIPSIFFKLCALFVRSPVVTGSACFTSGSNAILALSGDVGVFTILEPVSLSVNFADVPNLSGSSVLSVFAVLNGVGLSVTILSNGDNDTLAVLSRYNRIKDSSLRDLLIDSLNRSLVCCYFSSQLVDVVIVVLTANKSSWHSQCKKWE